MPYNPNAFDLDDISLHFHHIAASLDLLVDSIGNLSLERPPNGMERAQLVGLAAVVRDLSEKRSGEISDWATYAKIAPKAKS